MKLFVALTMNVPQRRGNFVLCGRSTYAKSGTRKTPGHLFRWDGRSL
ncbi:MAG: hypothetical protein K2O18_13500 [Oscillospiraceae bacterium]|nr:hypothetical protein [Oscillospiraceae bacterium]